MQKLAVMTQTSDTPVPILYSFRRCPYAMRARLAIASSGVRVELREIVLRDKAPEFLATSPSATVPCLVAGDENVIDESLDIMLWALKTCDPEGWLSPAQSTLEQMLSFLEQVDGPFKRHLDRYKYDTRFPDADAGREREAASVFLREVDDRLGHQGWMFGKEPSLGDYGFLPFLRQFANVDRDWFDRQDWPRLSAYLKGFEQSERFAAVMFKYEKWLAGAAPTLFPTPKTS